MQPTLILFKPDALERGLVGAILNRFEQAGLRVEDCRWVRPDESLLARHYAELKTRHPEVFARALAHFKDQPFVAMILSGPNAVQKVRRLTGPTDSLEALPGTVRGDYGSDSLPLSKSEHRVTFNLIHASDSQETAAQEIALWFPKA
jgi:nucleoside-diphosphate kinase